MLNKTNTQGHMLKCPRLLKGQHTPHHSEHFEQWTSHVNPGSDPPNKITHFKLKKYAKCRRDQDFPWARQHHSHLRHPCLKQQTGVGPSGAKLLLRIKLTLQNKLPVALEAPRDWHLQVIQDAGPLPAHRVLSLSQMTLMTGQFVWRVRGLKSMSGTHFTVKRGHSDSLEMCHVMPKFPSFRCLLILSNKSSLGWE